ncbi:hypothetical protein [Aliivibrio finisterrensis]|uniref:SHOCT domain-containing protein n=1 Tax=Aliivibrio finisterrensis TaxID=511998 RepID=A0ABY0I637_9GAMM|nr:hypothetical protein [Aliivibrio finisterrensis]RYU64336.1 hypothetical protein ERW53_10385 [Aliivibrio finisterrensis]RYU83948.1 hypothetical protein ERW52_12225 [Aliivibrio finisterrensis]
MSVKQYVKISMFILVLVSLVNMSWNGYNYIGNNMMIDRGSSEYAELNQIIKTNTDKHHNIELTQMLDNAFVDGEISAFEFKEIRAQFIKIETKE